MKWLFWPWELWLDCWSARKRRIDVKILWPICRDYAADADHARRAFAHHALQDSAWQRIGESRAMEIINGLDFPGID